MSVGLSKLVISDNVAVAGELSTAGGGAGRYGDRPPNYLRPWPAHPSSFASSPTSSRAAASLPRQAKALQTARIVPSRLLGFEAPDVMILLSGVMILLRGVS
jgi:hypothetical protein